MRKKQKKVNETQLMLWDDGPLTTEKRLWDAFLNLKEGQNKMRKRLFKEYSELKKENDNLKGLLWELRQSIQQKDLFGELFERVS